MGIEKVAVYIAGKMLTRNLKRALLDSQWSLPPTFLLPWAASLSTVSHTSEGSHVPPPLTNSGNHASTERRALHPSRKPPPVPYRPSVSSDEPKLPPPSASSPALPDERCGAGRCPASEQSELAGQ